MNGVVIIDDEPYVREMIRNSINWQAMSFEIKAEFFNGSDALNYIVSERGNVVLVITDLKMPVMNGIELIKRAKVIDPSLIFLVVSAYDEFHLVKEAFKLGVKEYILKSEITKVQMYNLLSDIRIQLHDGCVDTDRAYSVPVDKLLKENILQRIVTGSANEKEIISLGEILNPHNTLNITVALVKFMMCEKLANTKNTFLTQYEAYFLTNINSLLSCVEVVEITPYEFCVFAFFSKQKSISAIMSIIKGFHAALSALKCQVNMGISHTAIDLSLLPRLVYEARVSLEYCFVTGNGSANHYSYLHDQIAPLYFVPIKQYDKLKKILYQYQKHTGTQEFNELMIDRKRIKACNINSVKELYMHYYWIICDFCTENRIQDRISSLLHEYETTLKQLSDIQTLNLWLSRVLSEILNLQTGNLLIGRVKNYMEKNFDRDIKLQYVADEFGLNSSYLSRLFSEKEKVSFVDYLSEIRITKALELLKNTNLKIYEIAERVGFSNVEHFSRTFKKNMGMSPKQYIGIENRSSNK